MINQIGLSMYIVKRFQAGDVQVGMLGLAQSICYGMLAWVGGRLADRISKRLLMVTGLGLLACGLITLPLLNSLYAVIVAAGFCSLVQILVFPPYYGYIADTISPERLSRVIGINGMSLVGCAVVGAFIVGRIHEQLGAPAAFYASLGLCLFSLVFGSVFAPRRDEGAGPIQTAVDSSGETTTVSIHPAGAKFMYAAMMLNFTGFFTALIHQVFLARLGKLPEFSLSLTQQSNLHTARIIMGILGYSIGAFTSGWHWKRYPLFLGAAGLTTASLLAAFAPGPAVLAAAFCIGGVSTSFGSQMSLYYSVGGGVMKRGRAAGLNESALALGGGLGPFIGGQIADHAGTPRAALFVPLIPLALCAALWIKSLGRIPPRQDR
ncbi:MFS transporter [Candidatus Sumerlaeota bacterium]|nr:MFS transporter [Candidatus Sumerlaeota bacterium]